MSPAPPFISGQEPDRPGPLARYLPPLSAGVAAAWLAQHAPQGKGPGPGRVLDPFGASPDLAIEMARAGYRVLVAANNPVVRFVLELMAAPPQASELRAALAELAAAYKGSERIEPHLRSLYETECPQCGQVIMARAFLWERGASAPYARIVQCPACGEAGERPVTEADLARVAQLNASSAMYRSRALERVAGINDPDRAHAEEALAAYLPRAVYALFTLLNKLENLLPRHRRLVSALLLSAFDQGNTLWSHPTQRARPRQLVVPSRFRENNIWLALEEAITQWQAGPDPQPPIPITTWPEALPDSGGICIFEGRLKELAASQAELPILAVVTALPRPNQAYWTLSALWAGWLWGQAAAAPFKSVLRRRRYDWAWHITALYSAFKNLTPLLPPGAACLGLMSEAEPGFLSAVLVAAAQTGLELEGVALSGTLEQAQIHWRGASAAESPSPDGDVAKSAESAAAPEVVPASSVPQAKSADAIGDSGGAAESPVVPASSVRDGERAPTGVGDCGPGAKSADAIGDSGEALTPLPAEICLEGAHAYLLARQEPAMYLELHAAALMSLVQSPARRSLAARPPTEALFDVNNVLQKSLNYRGGFVRFGGSEHSLEVGQWWLRPDRLIQARQQAGKDAFPPPLADRVEIAVVKLLTQRKQATYSEVETAIYNEFPGLFTPDPALIEACLASYAHPSPTQPGVWSVNPQDNPAARRSDLAAISDLLTNAGKRLEYKVQGSAPGSIPITWSEPGGEVNWAFYVIASGLIGRLLEPCAAAPERCVIVAPGGRAGLIKYKLDNDPRLRLALADGWRFIKFRLARSLVENPRFSRQALPELLAQDSIESSEQQMTLL